MVTAGMADEGVLDSLHKRFGAMDADASGALTREDIQMAIQEEQRKERELYTVDEDEDDEEGKDGFSYYSEFGRERRGRDQLSPERLRVTTESLDRPVLDPLSSPARRAHVLR